MQPHFCVRVVCWIKNGGELQLYTRFAGESLNDYSEEGAVEPLRCDTAFYLDK